jgi:hypothetical protein
LTAIQAEPDNLKNETGYSPSSRITCSWFLMKRRYPQFFSGLLDFLHPSLFAGYVLISVISGLIFTACYFGFGSWFRIGGIVVVLVVPAVFILLLAVILVGRLQVAVWMRLSKQPLTEGLQLPASEVVWRLCLVALIVSYLSAEIGGKFPERRARKICDDCTSLIADLENQKRVTGCYPTNAPDLVKSNTILRRRYVFYFGESTTNGIDWTPDKIMGTHVSLFVATNRFQCIIPIEKLSPVSFSSFYVYSCTSEHPTWNKVLLHWSLLGAYVDDPAP